MSLSDEVAVSGAGKKHDAGKPRYDLLPPRATRAYVDVLTYGAAKYTANGWRKVVGWRWRYMRAGLTHAFGYLAGRLRGEPVPLDSETGLPELAHAMCCISFVLDNDLALAAGASGVPDGDAPAPIESQVGPSAPVEAPPATTLPPYRLATADDVGKARMDVWLACQNASPSHGAKRWRDGAVICDDCHEKVVLIEQRWKGLQERSAPIDAVAPTCFGRSHIYAAGAERCICGAQSRGRQFMDLEAAKK